MKKHAETLSNYLDQQQAEAEHKGPSVLQQLLNAGLSRSSSSSS